MRNITIIILLLTSFTVCSYSQDGKTNQSSQVNDPKMDWWKEAKYGMFIHWGAYSKLAGEWKGKTGYGEHIMLSAKIPISEYEPVAKSLNPVDFNADEWVLAAKKGGIKYVVITSKHHEGFAMFNSPSDPYNIVNFSVFKRDPIKELSNACSKYGVKFGVYYSLGRDWHDQDVPTNWPTKGGRSNIWDFPNEDAKVFSRYFERKVKPQIKELITQYHPAIIWFDTPELITKAQSHELRTFILKLDSTCIINDRIGNGFGDFKTLEQKGGENIIPGIWETCITMSRNWGYVTNDTIYKSSEKLIGLLIDAVSKGGNLLLNVGPTAEGVIRKENLDRMSDIGKWLSINGDAIYGARPWKVYGENADSSTYKSVTEIKSAAKDEVYDGTPKDVVPDIRFTTNGKFLYAIARSWRNSEVFITSLNSEVSPVKSIAMLGYKGKLEWKQTDSGTTIVIPDKAVTTIPVYVFRFVLN